MPEFPDVWTIPGSKTYHAYKDCGHARNRAVVMTRAEARSHGKTLCELCEAHLLDERSGDHMEGT